MLIAFQVSGFAFTWISKPAYDSVFPAGTNVLLEAYVEIPVERVEFFVDGVFVGSDDTLPYQANYIAVAGNHNATAVSVTQSGFRDESQPQPFRVFAPFQITSPDNGAVIREFPLYVIVAVSGSHKIDKIDFYADEQLIGTATNSVSFPWRPAEGGTFLLKAIGITQTGIQLTSPPVSVTVIGPPPIRILSPSQGQGIPLGSSVQITAEPRPPLQAGNLFFSISGVVSNQFTTNVVGPPFTFEWTAPEPRFYSVRASVTNADGKTYASDPVVFDVMSPPPPVVITITSPLEGENLPRGNHHIDFFWNRPADSQRAYLDGVELLESHSGNRMLFTVMTPGEHVLKVQLSLTTGEIAEAERRFFITNAIPRIGLTPERAQTQLEMIESIRVRLHAVDDFAIDHLDLLVDEKLVATVRPSGPDEKYAELEYLWSTNKPGTYVFRGIVWDRDGASNVVVHTTTIGNSRPNAPSSRLGAFYFRRILSAGDQVDGVGVSFENGLPGAVINNWGQVAISTDQGVVLAETGGITNHFVSRRAGARYLQIDEAGNVFHQIPSATDFEYYLNDQRVERLAGARAAFRNNAGLIAGYLTSPTGLVIQFWDGINNFEVQPPAGVQSYATYETLLALNDRGELLVLTGLDLWIATTDSSRLVHRFQEGTTFTPFGFNDTGKFAFFDPDYPSPKMWLGTGTGLTEVTLPSEPFSLRWVVPRWFLTGWDPAWGALNVNDEIVFLAWAQQYGIGPILFGGKSTQSRIIGMGDVLEGRKVTSVGFDRGLNDNFEIAFVATLEDKSQHIYVAFAAPRIGHPSIDPGAAAIRFETASGSGSAMMVGTSDDLKNWRPLTNTPMQGSTPLVRDVLKKEAGGRFYRLEAY